MWYNKNMGKGEKNLQNISFQIIPILRAEGVENPALFGSFAEGTAKSDSDVDILVDLPKGKTLFDLVGLKLKLEDKLKRKVDLITYASLSPYLKEIILSKRKPLYG